MLRPLAKCCQIVNAAESAVIAAQTGELDLIGTEEIELLNPVHTHSKFAGRIRPKHLRTGGHVAYTGIRTGSASRRRGFGGKAGRVPGYPVRRVFDHSVHYDGTPKVPS